MKLQQLRYLREVAKSGLNLSAAAEALHTSQPGISKQIRQLEDELGVQILVRHGKRVVEITEPGKLILNIAERMLKDVENLKQVAREYSSEDTGALVIETEAEEFYEGLVLLPCYQWNRGVITPPGHALARERQLTLEGIARYPL